MSQKGGTVKFQSLSAAQGRVYRCNNCRKSFVKVKDEFLEILNSKNHVTEERLHAQKKKVIEMATVVKEQVRETKQMDVSLTHEELVLKRNPVAESRHTTEKPVETRTEIKIPLKKEEIERYKTVLCKRGCDCKEKPCDGNPNKCKNYRRLVRGVGAFYVVLTVML